MRLFRLIIFFIFSGLYQIAFGELPNSGLFFHSHEANQDERTSLLLNSGQEYLLKKKDVFSLEFDVCLRDEHMKFGYIVRIISDLDENFDLLIGFHDDKKFLVINQQDFPLYTRSIVDEYGRVCMEFDKQQKELRLFFHGDTIIHSHPNLANTSSLRVNFGACAYGRFLTNDVPPVILKEIRVSYNQKTHHHWKLDKHGVNCTYDEIRGAVALAHHPEWLVDRNVYWEKCGSMTVKSFPQLSFDSISNRIVALTDSGCLSFALADKQINLLPMQQDIPLNTDMNLFLFNSLNGKIMNYNVEPVHINYYDQETGQWQLSAQTEENADYAHHNRYISPNDSCLYIFGGYGYYKYKGDLTKVNLNNGEILRIDLSAVITPRYLAAMGGNVAGNKIYILGGKGAYQGKQELTPLCFSDLYVLNTDSLMSSPQIYQLPRLEEKDYVFSNNLIVDESEKYLYVLSYPNRYTSQVVLKRFSFEESKWETLGDSIPFCFQDNQSFCDLYYSPSLSKLVAVLAQESTQPGYTTVDIYSLGFPPMKEEWVLQLPATVSFTATMIKLLAFILLLGVGCYFWKKKSKDKSKIKKTVNQKTDETTSVAFRDVTQKHYAKKKASILFLGGFQVFDKNGNNITSEFSPTLKYLLILFIIHTIKNGQGISSLKLVESLWSDKSESEVRNTRNVHIRRLRVLLERVAEIEISYKNDFWMIDVPDTVFLEYREAIHLLDQVEISCCGEKEMERFIELFSSGDLLPNIQHEWIDGLKSDFSNRVVDICLHFLNDPYSFIANNTAIRMKIADVILLYDLINEEAITVKCRVLYALGKNGLAKTAFDHFARNYVAMLGEEYPKTLQELLKVD